jgi:hypothetical protein
MNYFFTITSNFLSCKLTVPKFQNRGLHNKSLKIFSIKISNYKDGRPLTIMKLIGKMILYFHISWTRLFAGTKA